MKRYEYIAIAVILTVYLCLLIRAAAVNSPVMSEDALLASGVSHYKYSRFDLYRVNPPLVRLLAAFPVKDVLAEERNGWWRYDTDPLKRSEFLVGLDVAKTRKDYTDLMCMARLWVAIPFGLIGAIACFFGARTGFGQAAGIVALFLWSFNPYVLGHGLTIMNDVPAAAMGVAALFLFWKWLRCGNFESTVLAGLTLGLAELCKFTLLIFYPLFVLIWILHRIPDFRTTTRKELFLQAKTQAGQLVIIFAISLLVINMGYLFENTCKPLGSFKFQTSLLSGVDSLKDVPSGGGNRFANSLLGKIPVPLPANFVQGIDTQRLDFERGLPSYLRGEWSDHGWWHYYLYALLIKTPLGTLGLCLLAIFCTLFIRSTNTSWRDEMVILLPGLVILAFVSSQTGFSVHSRYVIPALPFFFIWMSKVGKAISWQRPIFSTLTISLLVWSIGSSLWVYPHSISYFNELVGGPKNGGKHLLDSNIDWGQDLFYLEKWCKAHSEVTEIKCAVWGSYPLDQTSILDTGMPFVNDPQPGWYALSVNYLYDREKQYRYFLEFEPVARIGYSIYVYHLTKEGANRMRKEL